MVGAGRAGVNPSMGKGFLFSVQWVPGFFPKGAGIKNELTFTSSPPAVCLHGMDRDNFNLYLRSNQIQGVPKS